MMLTEHQVHLNFVKLFNRRMMRMRLCEMVRHKRLVKQSIQFDHIG